MKTDNRLLQLRYDTRRANQRDAVRNGRSHWANRTECPAGPRVHAGEHSVVSGRAEIREVAPRYYRSALGPDLSLAGLPQERWRSFLPCNRPNPLPAA